jgi:hypothetical protein
LGFDPIIAAYRVEGQRGPTPSRALIRSDHPAPEAALAALVGPLVLFRREDEEMLVENDAAALSPPPSAVTRPRLSPDHRALGVGS